MTVVEIRRRTIPTNTPCPHCGQGLQELQWKAVSAEGAEPAEWSVEGHRCPRGCRLLAGEVQ